MFEAAEVGNRVSKEEYAREAPRIRTELLQMQKRLATAPLSVVILIAGVEGAGKGETVNLLLEWMDARGIDVHALWDTSDEERERPQMWRFWRVLPPTGTIGILFGSWYTAPIIDRVFGRINDAGFNQALDRILEFERMLAAENVLLVKLWLHLAKDVQRRRLRELEDESRAVLAGDQVGLEVLPKVPTNSGASRTELCGGRARAMRRGSSSRAQMRATGA